MTHGPLRGRDKSRNVHNLMNAESKYGEATTFLCNLWFFRYVVRFCHYRTRLDDYVLRVHHDVTRFGRYVLYFHHDVLRSSFDALCLHFMW